MSLFRCSTVSPLFKACRTIATSNARLNELNLTFASPGKVFYEKQVVKQVDVPGITGMAGVLAEHVPTIGVLKPGLLQVTESDGKMIKYFVSSGSYTVNADSTMQILAEEAVTLDMLDSNAIREGHAKAQSDYNSASGEAAKAEAQVLVEAFEALKTAVETK